MKNKSRGFGFVLLGLLFGGMGLLWLLMNWFDHPSHRHQQYESQKISKRDTTKTLPSSTTGTREPDLDQLSEEAIVEDAPLEASKEWSRIEALIRSSRLIQEWQSPPRADGRYKISKVYQTKSQFPRVTIIEEWKGDELIHQAAMVADHMIIGIGADENISEIAAIVSQYQAQLEEVDASSGLYLLTFDGSRAEAIPELTEALQEVDGLDMVQPDFLVTQPY